jgi:hypothetical protein
MAYRSIAVETKVIQSQDAPPCNNRKIVYLSFRANQWVEVYEASVCEPRHLSADHPTRPSPITEEGFTGAKIRMDHAGSTPTVWFRHLR